MDGGFSFMALSPNAFRISGKKRFNKSLLFLILLPDSLKPCCSLFTLLLESSSLFSIDS